MLSRLLIENLAIVERIEIRLAPGLNAITGETGSGKSILVGAMELALGDRASADVVRTGAKVASVEATFEGPFPREVTKLLVDELGLEWSADEPIIVRREVTAQGRSRAIIAGQMVNVSDLKRLGELLADLHGQHEHQSLFQLPSQRAALDAYGGYEKLLAKYRAQFEVWQQLRKRREELEQAAADFEKQMDFVQFQIDELEQLKPTPGELAALDAEEKRLAHAETLAQSAARALAMLYEGNDDDAPTALSAIGEAAKEMDQIARHDPAQAALSERAGELKALIEDLASELRDYLGKCEPDPKRLDHVIARIEDFKRLMRKHGATTEEQLAALLEKLTADRDRMTHDQDERREIVAKLEKAREELRHTADELFAARVKASDKFSAEIMRTLAQVGMEKAQFKVAVTPEEDFASEGADRVEFLLGANVGEGAHSLRDAASGGELSRTMLAIKTALAARDSIGTLVFDEIDTGISGQTAARVGRLMEKLGESHQVICITHHASIAARAAHHLCVSKSEQAGRTLAAVTELADDSRVAELAHMMGDQDLSAAGMKLARQLME